MKNLFINNSVNKKLVFFIIIVAFFIILLLLFSIDLISGNHLKEKGRPIAVVDGVVVYESDLNDRLASIAPGNQIKLENLPKNVLDAMVLEVVVNNKIDMEAKKAKYNNDKTINEITENFKKGLIREKYLNEKIYSKVSDNDVLNEYNKLSKNLDGKEERKIKHILVETEEEIERARRAVLRTGNFEKVAKDKSIDTATGEEGGDLGYVLKEELVPEFGNVAFILKVGEVSKPVHTQYGWHIIKVEDIRDAKLLPFEDVKDNLKQKLQQDVIQNYLLSITKDSNIDYKIDLKREQNNPQSITNDENEEK